MLFIVYVSNVSCVFYFLFIFTYIMYLECLCLIYMGFHASTRNQHHISTYDAACFQHMICFFGAFFPWYINIFRYFHGHLQGTLSIFDIDICRHLNRHLCTPLISVGQLGSVGWRMCVAERCHGGNRECFAICWEFPVCTRLFLAHQLVLAGESKNFATQFCKRIPVSLGYPLSVFNKNSTLKDALEPIVDTYEMECYSALSTQTCFCFSKPLKRPVVLNWEGQSEKDIHCRAPQLTADSHRPIGHNSKAPVRECPSGRCLNIVPAVWRGCFHLEKRPTTTSHLLFKSGPCPKKNANFTYLTWFHRHIKCHREAKMVQGEYRYFTV